MDVGLVFDVGMHTGEDTDFYLKKGFRVVAVEANPSMVEAAQRRFSRELENGSLIIVGKAIASEDGIVRFAINSRESEWGTIETSYAQRNELVGTTNQWIDVPATKFESVLREYGVPYFLKVDVEGADHLCIEALSKFPDRPIFVSVELTLLSFADYFDVIANLWSLGYRKFKIVNQRLVQQYVCPSPSKEGSYVDYRFRKGSSGLFGNEVPGDWAGVEDTFRRVERIARRMQRHSPLSGTISNSLYSRYVRLLYERVIGDPIAWYDLHATI